METRKTALFWAGQTGDVGVSDLMRIYRTSGDFEMREQVIFVLSQTDSKEAVDSLLELAKTESDVELRTKAIFWLGQSDDERVVEYLGELIER
jgi:HEAT repeat protein